jgi:hypothetical protein
MMHREHATPAQRIGSILTFLEAGLFGVLCALHLGARLHIGRFELSSAFVYPAAVVEGLLAIALFLAVALPADGSVRAGRVMGAQILAVLALFVLQVALLHSGPTLEVASLIPQGSALVLSLASIALVAAPIGRRPPVVP